MENKAASVKSFFKGSIVLIFSNICLKAINFFLLPLYTKSLAPWMLGVSDTITSFTGLLFPILVMGLDSAFSAFYHEKNRPEQSVCVFNTITVLLRFLGVIPFIMCIFSDRLSVLLFKDSSYIYAIVISLISISINLCFLPYALELRMQNRMVTYSLISVAASLTMVILNILFVSILSLGIYALILSNLSVQILQLLLFSVFVKKKIRKKYIDWNLAKQMLHFSLPLVPTAVAMWVLTLSDRTIILQCLGEAQVGLYGIGSRFVGLVNMIVSGITMAYTTFAYANKDSKEAKEQYAWILNIMYILLGGMSFIIAVFSKEIITVMTSEEYYSSYRIIRDMMFGQTVYAISTIVSYGIYFRKKSIYSLISTSVAAMVNLLLNLIFIPRFGIRAAAFTTLIGYLCMMMINYYISQKLYPCKYGLRRILVSMLVLYGAAMLFEESFWGVKLGISLVCAVLTLFIFWEKIKESMRWLK